jgi:hypothetical protein
MYPGNVPVQFEFRLCDLCHSIWKSLWSLQGMRQSECCMVSNPSQSTEEVISGNVNYDCNCVYVLAAEFIMQNVQFPHQITLHIYIYIGIRK